MNEFTDGGRRKEECEGRWARSGRVENPGKHQPRREGVRPTLAEARVGTEKVASTW